MIFVILPLVVCECLIFSLASPGVSEQSGPSLASPRLCLFCDLYLFQLIAYYYSLNSIHPCLPFESLFSERVCPRVFFGDAATPSQVILLNLSFSLIPPPNIV